MWGGFQSVLSFMSVTHSMALMVDLIFVAGQQQLVQLATAFTVSGHDLNIVFLGRALQLVIGVFGQAFHLFFFLSQYRGKGYRPRLGFDEDLYTGASRVHASDCIDYYVHRNGAPKK